MAWLSKKKKKNQEEEENGMRDFKQTFFREQGSALLATRPDYLV